MTMRPFHLAVPVDDLEQAEHFYGGLLGCAIGRRSPQWIDFDFFGHQVTVHLQQTTAAVNTSSVDGKSVPVRHFGVILEWQHWQSLSEHLRQHDVDWLIEPGIRFEGQPGEQATFFIRDPSGNALEFKAFRDDGQIFSTTG